jgi:acetaldehyde dehydrogenase
MSAQETKPRTKVAIIGSGNIGTDLMFKILRLSKTLELVALVGIDPQSDGLRRARDVGVNAVSSGLKGLIALPQFKQIEIIFDATSAAAHVQHDKELRAHGKRLIDMTPAAVGPFLIPCVNGDAHRDARNLNMVTCGGQATIPIVAAISRVCTVHYAEIVASIASKSAGPGTRANIDEFTETTARAIVDVGGARRGKAIIVLNPAEPPLIMRDTVYCLAEGASEQTIATSIAKMVAEVHSYVPGYRLKQAVQFEALSDREPLHISEMNQSFAQGLKISVFLEVEGAAHYLPAYAGNLDIMTSSALRAAENLVSSINREVAA